MSSLSYYCEITSLLNMSYSLFYKRSCIRIYMDTSPPPFPFPASLVPAFSLPLTIS